jgi:hypothetical protein
LENVVNAIARFFTVERTAAIAVLAIASWQLLLPPVLGLADNGDYARVMVFFDLTHEPQEWGDRYVGFLNRHYVFDRVEASKYAGRDFISSEWVFVAAAAALNRLLSPASFDLLLLGALHVLIFVLSAYFLLAASKSFAGPTRTIGIILGIVVFTDIGYIAYFNSFYTESASYIFLLIVAGCAYGAISSPSRRIPWTVAYCLSVVAFTLAKYQNLVLLPVFLFFGFMLVKRSATLRYRYAYLVAVLVLSYVGYRFFLSSPPAVDDAVLYNSVFNGILVDSPTPREDLIAFGIDPELAGFAGTTAFSPNSLRYNSEFLRNFRGFVTIGGVTRFYLQRPRRLYAALNRTVALAFKLRPELGNYEKSAQLPAGARSSSWAMWSSVRAGGLPRSIWLVLAVALLHLCLLARKWVADKDPVSRLNLEWLALLVPLAFAQLFLVTISDGVSDATKHALLFNLLLDCMMVAIAAQLLGGRTTTQRSKQQAQGKLA